MSSFPAALSRVILPVFAGLFCLGCGPTGFKITPVPVDQTLEEKTLIHEGGLLPKKIALVDVSGMLLNSDGSSLFGSREHSVAYLVEQLDKAARDDSVVGVILRINSPGGSVTASDLMYAEVRHFKQRTGGDKPVVAVLMDVAASGGYYVACSADEIIAHRTTITGSIGVIMQMLNVSGTMNKIGIDAEAIKSGKMKDAGSPLRAMTPDERAVFQSLVDQLYAQFVHVVAEGREGLDETRVRELADGRVYSAQQAVELGFVDRIGSIYDAVDSIKRRTDQQRVRVVTYHRPLAWKPNIYAEMPPAAPQTNFININLPDNWPHNTPRFMYLWSPGG